MNTRHEKTRSMRGLPAVASALCLAVSAQSASAQTEIFQSMTSSTCTPGSQQAVAENARENVESRVARAEAAIQAPLPIEDLACLNDLMNIDIDFLSGDLFSVGDVFGDLMAGLDATTLVDQAGNAVTRQICDFAAQKWGELTEPLNMGVGDLTDQITQASNDVSSEFTEGFSFVNVSPNGGPAPAPAPAPVAPTPTPTPAPNSAPPQNTDPDSDVQSQIQGIYDNINSGN